MVEKMKNGKWIMENENAFFFEDDNVHLFPASWLDHSGPLKKNPWSASCLDPVALVAFLFFCRSALFSFPS